MAGNIKCFTALHRFILTNHIKLPIYSQVRHSRYSKIYLEPTFRKEQLQEPLVDTDPRRFQPIKAAENDQLSLSSYDELLSKFIRIMMKEGNKHRARLIMSKTFENIKLTQLEKYHKATTEFERDTIELDPKKILHQAVDNCKPLLIIQRVKRGGVMYQVPIPVSSNYQQFRAVKWLIESANEKEQGVSIWDKLAFELLDAFSNEGKSVRKKQELHRVCEANRAYAHFRW
jgi:small subunit ribosomal protein S7